MEVTEYEKFPLKEGKMFLPSRVVQQVTEEFPLVDVPGELKRLSWWLRSRGHEWVGITLIRRWMSNSKLEKKVAGNVPEGAKSGSHEAIDLNLLFAGLTKEEREKRMRAYGWI